MKSVMHDPEGNVYIGTPPSPACTPRNLLVNTAFGWISSGTEAGFLRKMRQKRSDDPKHYPLGYTASGVIAEVGEEVAGFSAGDKVGLYGSPYVNHTQTLSIGRNLAVPVPDTVPLYDAASVGLGAIGLHGIRQIGVTLGDIVILVGLGPLGQITAQLIEACGADVIALDLLEPRIKLAQSCIRGHALQPDLQKVRRLVNDMTRGRGADALVLCISGDVPVAGEFVAMLRHRGRVSLLGGSAAGLPGLAYARRNEIEFKFVRAGGPGRRDPVYEVDGVDYPAGYVPWTENRNMEAVLRMMASGRLNVTPLISHCFPIDNAPKAFELIINHPEKTMGVVINVSGDTPCPPTTGDLM